MSSTRNDLIRCSTCGALLRSSVLGKVCPACLLLDSAPDTPDQPTDLETANMGGGKQAPPVRGFFIPGHEVLEEIASGGMGVVYRARQFEPPRDVALKMLLPAQMRSSELRERFRIEARAAAALDHPAILPLYAFGEYDGLPWFTMKLAAGGSLAGRSTEFAGKFRAVAELVAALADGLQHAHDRGLLHRDLKPSNILFDAEGRPYISDFGLAKFTRLEPNEELTSSLSTLGTPRYLAPEAARGARHAVTASDIYGLGAILYELLTGRPPFMAHELPALLRQIGEEEPEAPSSLQDGIPFDLEVICLKCLSKEPAARYASAGALASDVRLWLDQRPITARPVSAGERLWRFTRRNPVLAGLAAALASFAIVAGIAQVRANARLGTALRRSLVNEAAALRGRGEVGWQKQALAVLTHAIELGGSSPELRDELIALHAAPRILPGPRWAVKWEDPDPVLAWSPDLEHFVMPVRAPGSLEHANLALDQTAPSSAPRSTPAYELVIFSTETRRPVRTLARCSARLRRLAFSPDGQKLSALFEGNEATILRVADNRNLLNFHETANLDAVEFSADSNQVVVSVSDLGIFRESIPAENDRNQIEDSEARSRSGSPLDTSPHSSIASAQREFLTREPGPVNRLAPAPDVDRLAVARANQLELWSWKDRRRIWATTVPEQTGDVVWSSDNKLLATASGKTYAVLVFEARDGRIRNQLSGHSQAPETFVFHPAGKSFITAGRDHRVHSWNLETGQNAVSWSGLSVPMQFAPFPQPGSPDAWRLGGAPGAGELGFTDFVMSKLFGEWEAVASPATRTCSFVQSSGGELSLITTSRGFVLADQRTPRAVKHERLEGLSGECLRGYFGADSKSIILSGAGRGVWQHAWSERRTETGARVLEIGPAEVLTTVADAQVHEVAPDGTSLVIGTGAINSRRIELWPKARPEHARTIATGANLHDFRLSPDGQWGVSTTFPSSGVIVWELRGGQSGARPLGIETSGEARFSPDARWLVVATAAGHYVFEVGSWRRRAFRASDLSVKGGGVIAISRDSRFAAFEQANARVQMVTLPDLLEVFALTPPIPIDITALLFNPDGRFLQVAGGGRVFVWHLRNVRKELILAGLEKREK